MLRFPAEIKICAASGGCVIDPLEANDEGWLCYRVIALNCYIAGRLTTCGDTQPEEH